jgi:hypothetical protein
MAATSDPAAPRSLRSLHRLRQLLCWSAAKHVVLQAVMNRITFAGACFLGFIR